jgi:hypothetical protein
MPMFALILITPEDEKYVVGTAFSEQGILTMMEKKIGKLISRSN